MQARSAAYVQIYKDGFLALLAQAVESVQSATVTYKNGGSDPALSKAVGFIHIDPPSVAGPILTGSSETPDRFNW